MTNHDKNNKASENVELNKKPFIGTIEQKAESLITEIQEESQLEIGDTKNYNRQKAWYGVEQGILLFQDSTIAPLTVQGKRIAFTKFSKLILEQDGLYKKLGFMKENEVPEGYKNTTPVYFGSYTEAARQGLVVEVEFSIEATTKAIWAPFGKIYKTYVPYSTRLPLIDIGFILKETNFLFGKSPYQLKLGSVKQKKSKKTTPTFL